MALEDGHDGDRDRVHERHAGAPSCEPGRPSTQRRVAAARPAARARAPRRRASHSGSSAAGSLRGVDDHEPVRGRDDRERDDDGAEPPASPASPVEGAASALVRGRHEDAPARRGRPTATHHAVRVDLDGHDDGGRDDRGPDRQAADHDERRPDRAPRATVPTNSGRRRAARRSVNGGLGGVDRPPQVPATAGPASASGPRSTRRRPRPRWPAPRPTRDPEERGEPRVLRVHAEPRVERSRRSAGAPPTRRSARRRPRLERCGPGDHRMATPSSVDRTQRTGTIAAATAIATTTPTSDSMAPSRRGVAVAGRRRAAGTGTRRPRGARSPARRGRPPPARTSGGGAGRRARRGPRPRRPRRPARRTRPAGRGPRGRGAPRRCR